MGLTGATPAAIAKAIVKRRDPGDLAKDGPMRLCVFHPPSRRGRDDNLPEQLVEIDCYVPIAQSHVAQQLIGRVNALLNNQRVGQCELSWGGHLGDLPTTAGFYCEAIRFKYNTIV